MTDASTQAPRFALPPLPQLREEKVFGRRICHYDIGKGPPLVLVHGVGGDADQWMFCLDDFAASHRVIAVDLLGFGRSDKPLIDYRVAGFVEVLDRLLARIGIAKASLLGHSLGGWITAAFALEFPSRVDKLILNDAVGIDAGAVPFPVDLNISTRAHMRRVFDLMFYDTSGVSDELVDLAYSLHLERGDGYTIKSVLECFPDAREKLDRKLAQLAMPTLVLWGENDVIAPLAMAHAWQRGIAGSRLHIIGQCGHMPPLEEPKEFNAAVKDFLGAS